MHWESGRIVNDSLCPCKRVLAQVLGTEICTCIDGRVVAGIEWWAGLELKRTQCSSLSLGWDLSLHKERGTERKSRACLGKKHLIQFFLADHIKTFEYDWFHFQWAQFTVKFESSDILEISRSGNNFEGIRKEDPVINLFQLLLSKKKDWKSQLRTKSVLTFAAKFHFLCNTYLPNTHFLERGN